MPACRRRDTPYWLGPWARRLLDAETGRGDHDFTTGNGTRSKLTQNFAWRSAAVRLEEGTAEVGLARSLDVMTQDSSAATPAYSYAATTAFLIACLGIAAILGAYFFEFVVKLAPCPLCLEQRIPYYVGIPLALVIALAARQKVPAGLIALGFAALGIVFLIGAGLGVYHAGIEWKFWPGPTECSGPIGQLGGSGGLLDQIQTTSLVRCDEAAWRFMGISLAGYNVLISLFIVAQASVMARRLLAR